MKCLWALVAIVGCAVALPDADSKFGDGTYLEKQKDLMLTLHYIHQPHWNADQYLFGVNYRISADYDNYNNVEKVKEFVKLYNHKRLLPRHADFSLYNAEHLFETKALFDVFYNAKNYETLAKVVTWARINVNEKLFMYVVGVVITHRDDISNLIMPPPYEVCPYQFVNSEVIKAAQRMKMKGFHGVELVDGHKEVIIPMNYTGWYMHMNPEQKVSYYTEDVGLNSVNYNFHLDYPHWLEGKPYGLDKDRRGELYIIFHHQMTARYYLERLSNDLGHIPAFNWREPIKSGYHPSLMAVNGKQFPTRPNFYNLYTEGNHKFVQEAEDRERRIRDIVDKGYFKYDGKTVSLSKPEDVNTLGNLLQGNPDSSDLHHNYHDHIVPSFLENYATAARDPLFYQFHNNLMNNFWKFMSHVTPYTHEEVDFPGVDIVSAEVDNIQTFFQNFDLDITNAIDVEPELITKKPEEVTNVEYKPDEYMIKARSTRLNHKPFTYKFTVKSDKAQMSSVRVFLGPKYDEYGNHVNFEKSRRHFVFLDIFKYSLTAGENVIVKKSTDILYYGSEQTTFYELYKRLMLAKSGEKEWSTELFAGRCQFPKYLMVPKGKHGGMTYQLYIVISPFLEPKTPVLDYSNPLTLCGVGTGARFFEDRALLYPLDRHIDSKHFYVSNMKFLDVEIFFNAEENAARYY